jgi:branched-chain amino acid transport system substrate-binding protein
VRRTGGARVLALQRFDSKGATGEAWSLPRSALDQGVGFVLQGNSSAIEMRWSMRSASTTSGR